MEFGEVEVFETLDFTTVELIQLVIIAIFKVMIRKGSNKLMSLHAVAGITLEMKITSASLHFSGGTP